MDDMDGAGGQEMPGGGQELPVAQGEIPGGQPQPQPGMVPMGGIDPNLPPDM